MVLYTFELEQQWTEKRDTGMGKEQRKTRNFLLYMCTKCISVHKMYKKYKY